MMARTASHPYDNVPLILVTGQGRSGTTVLTKCLNTHPAVHSTNKESNLIVDVLDAAQRGCTLPSRQKQMRVSQARYDAIFRQMLLELLWPETRHGTEFPLAISTFSAMRPTIADYMVTVFPGMHFACIVRNGIEVVSSRMVHWSFKKMTFEEHCRSWAQARDMVEWGQGREDFTLFRQESVGDEGETTARFDEIFRRYAIEDPTPCVRFITADPIHTTAHPDEDEASRSLAHRKQRWRFWSEEQRAMFVDLCHPTMQYFNYPIPWL